jgi:hypothetical protein
MPKVFRAMYPDGEMPKLGTTKGCLGARLKIDIAPDQQQLVRPSQPGAKVKGMSVNPSVKSMHFAVVPPKYGALYGAEGAAGDDLTDIWESGTGPFKHGEPAGADLVLHVDKPTHGVFSPDREMHVDQYQAALAATRNGWQKVSVPDDVK